MRRAARVDNNQKAIVAALRQIPGVTVYHLQKPLDLLIGFRGLNYVVDVKGSRSTAITPPQVKFFAEWTGQAALAYSLDEVLEIIFRSTSSPSS